MHGETSAAMLQGANAVRVPELGRLKAAAERIAYATKCVDAFLYRFHGPRPENAAAEAPPPPDSYRNDLDSLFAQIDRLEAATNALEGIG